jgi:hypothetical protein
MFIYDNYDNKYDNTISYSCLLFIKDLITMSLEGGDTIPPLFLSTAGSRPIA